MRKTLRLRGLALIVSIFAACSPSVPYPETISFGRQQLRKAHTWTRDGMSGVVYVPRGEKLPSAHLQVAVIVSDGHTIAADLHAWIGEQGRRAAAAPRVHESGAEGESCHVATTTADGGRPYLALQVCQAGVARAACVEADEALDHGAYTSCLNRSRCFEDLCNQRWLSDREALDVIVADFLARR